MRHDQAEGLRKKLAGLHSGKQAEATIIFGGHHDFLLRFAKEIAGMGKKVMLIQSDTSEKAKGTLASMARNRQAYRDLKSEETSGISHMQIPLEGEILSSLNTDEKAFLVEQYKDMLNDYDCILIDAGEKMPESRLIEQLKAKNILLVTTADSEGMKKTYSILKNRFAGDRTGTASLLLIVEAVSEDAGRRALMGLPDLASRYLQLEILTVGILQRPDKQMYGERNVAGVKDIANSFMTIQR